MTEARFFVVRKPDGSFVTAYNSQSSSPKMYVRVGDARKYAEQCGGEVNVIQFRLDVLPEADGRGCVHVVHPEFDDLYRKHSTSLKPSHRKGSVKVR